MDTACVVVYSGCAQNHFNNLLRSSQLLKALALSVINYVCGLDGNLATIFTIPPTSVVECYLESF